MQEFKIIGHIDLPERKIRPEEYRNFLEAQMRDLQSSVNEEFGYHLLDEENKISIEGGPDTESDQKFISDLETNWATQERKTVEEWQKSKDRNPSTIAELAITLVLHKLLGNRFIVARASTFDDYKHHVDNVLIDKETGAVVCGFDEVLGFTGDDGSEKKDKKIKENLSRGGTSLKYGATIVDGKVERKSLENIPTFFLSLSKEELSSLLVDLKSNKLPTEAEKKIVLKMIASLESQYDDAKKIAINNNLNKNLDKFAASLEIIKNQINQ